MKRTGYISGKRVKVAGNQIVTATKLQRLEDPLLWVTSSGDIGPADLDLDTIMAAAGSEVPAGAIGIILQVEVWDSATLPLVRLYKDASETHIAQHGYVQAQVPSVWINWQGIIELSATNTIRYLVANATDMSLSLKLVGWVIAAE